MGKEHSPGSEPERPFHEMDLGELMKLVEPETIIRRWRRNGHPDQFILPLVVRDQEEPALPR